MESLTIAFRTDELMTMSRESAETVLGCQLFLAGRLLYLPLYAFGVPVVRTIAWAVSLSGLITIIKAILA